MLHGIGGSSIAEAKENLSYDEVIAWSHYIRKRGSLNWGMRIEQGFALLAFLFSRVNGGMQEIEEFMPHADKQEASLEDVMKKWS